MRELGCFGLIFAGFIAVVFAFYGGIIWTIAAAAKWAFS